MTDLNPSRTGFKRVMLKLGGEMFGLGILGIKEIIEYRIPTEVPMMPPSIRGVINLRGTVLPIIDLGARFGLETSEPTARHDPQE